MPVDISRTVGHTALDFKITKESSILSTMYLVDLEKESNHNYIYICIINQRMLEAKPILK